MSYYGFPRYVPVAEKREKAAKKIKQLRKKTPNIHPVVIEGNAIAKTWWGKSWNNNLESYADYSNRIGRGRSYVRHGAVLDLQIEPGKVKAIVNGSASKPYQINIKIKGIPKSVWNEIKLNCKGKLDSLQELLTGKFPKSLSDLFTMQGKGIFPSPKEIEFDCSCPDWAVMCKHVAATLYGIGSRLDQDPSLFFKLRKVDIDDLISQTVETTTQELLKKSAQKSSKIIDDSNLTDVFGIDLDGEFDSHNLKKEKSTPRATKRKTKKKGKELTRQQSKGKNAASKKVISTNPPINKASKNIASVNKKVVTAIQTVTDIINNSRQGIAVKTIENRSGLTKKQLANILFKLKKQGKIISVSRGIYRGK